MYKKLLSAEHPSVASSLHDLAFLYESQGRYTEAEPLFIQALDMRKKLLGSEHPDVATYINNLALLYFSQGDIASAVQYYKRGLEIQEKNLTYNLTAGAEPQKDKYLKSISGAKEEGADDGKEVIHDALVDTKLCNFVLCKLFD